ncbi:tRNA1(Val) (adenine(37)-N6)-methyltransferase [Empedobacter brevis NBRC 14943 = ATCC 43319]|uniref:tRNA1(Val) (adenine(37)-N6)-methyltransferase n=1 Tax=Empedobacter brevis NBRC 14943 = ATCC 43319 TaxID=1218108 RepID=A0A511NKS4_9FLAO|nr:methyltransferase [Empedobacter brevis]GEM53412.1 tRNA1(Val) (adenine(37)-N6)-methyltransferase [Empedobacter brevis NBRC 14943 = ATCC 43319]
MNRKPFRFKQFEIFQDKTAMKVGTDGVLLGAWSNLETGDNILDIGAGTGLISLMLAQRFPNSRVDAIEIDYDAFLQAKENFEHSIFSERLKIKNTSLQVYSNDKKYDLIVSNPPFFTVNNSVDFDARKQARQQETLTFAELIEKSAKLLHKEGVANFIIPYDQMDIFCEKTAQNDLKLSRIVYVKGNSSSPIKRVLLEFSFQERIVRKEELVIERERHQYTNEYISLTKDFYLKM